MKEVQLRSGHVKSDRYNFYVTEDGHVFQLDKRNGQIKEMFYHVAHGYRRVRITDVSTATRRYYRVSRLVAQAFVIKSDPTFEIVNHKDGNKVNDHKDNLEWCNISINTQHAYDNDLVRDRGGWISTPYSKRKAV